MVGVLTVLSAAPEPRPLTEGDADTWRMIFTPTLSRDGQWLAYSYMPQEDDGDIVLRQTAGKKEIREPIGSKPPAPVVTPPDAPNPERQPPARDARIAFTSDSRFVVVTTFPTHAEQVQARIDKKKSEDSPKDGLLIIDLSSGKTERIAAAKAMQVPLRGGAWMAYSKDTPPRKSPPLAEGTEEKPAEKKKDLGFDLVVRNLASGEERVIPFVFEFSFARDGKSLVYAVSAEDEKINGVYVLTPGEAAAPVALLTGPGRYRKLTWDRSQTQLAFMSDRDNHANEAPLFSAYLWKRGAADVATVITTKTEGLPAGQSVSENGSFAFSRDGKKLYAPIAESPKAKEKTPPRDPADTVSADIWRWDDGQVQPLQKVRASRESKRTYRGAIDLESGGYTQLSSAEFPDISLNDNGTRALAGASLPYERLVDYDGTYTDFYLVDTTTGARTPVLKKVLTSAGGSNPVWSPDGEWTVFYQNGNWSLLNMQDGATRVLTEKLGVSFSDEQNDMSQPPVSYGSAGWMQDSTAVLLYDRYDLWQVFIDGRPAKNLTAGFGRANKIQLRHQSINRADENDEAPRGVDPEKPLVFRGENETTRATGFYRTTFAATGAPESLLSADKNFRYVGRSQEADKLIITASRFDEFPDVHVTDENFSAPVKLTDGGAQTAPFIWGTGELVSYQSAQGVPLQGALFKPANFDPKKKYPMIVYFYERLSQELHTFYNPAPSHRINFADYVSNGYLVFTPDIVYQMGYPGKSAMDCVVPGTEAVIKMGFVDEKRIGLQGHSWGGYQIAYMITKTDMFRAAEAGAPVGNMTSAYSGIRWGSGLPRQFQYEKTQSRINGTLQDATALYLENSPVFHIKNVHTPLLILHNDSDDAVPWYQGIELFLALRRFDKPAWLITYNGEFHGIRRRANQKDFTKRMRGFFDYYLKDAPAPEWMTKGVPYLEREEEKLRFNAEPAKP